MYTYIDIYVCVCVSVTKPSLSPLRLDENASSYSEHVYKEHGYETSANIMRSHTM